MFELKKVIRKFLGLTDNDLRQIMSGYEKLIASEVEKQIKLPKP